MSSEMLFPENEISGTKIKEVIKRDGRVVAFDRNKITDSIFRAAVGAGGSDMELAEKLTSETVKIINAVFPAGSTPGVEEIQDVIEKVLVENRHYKTAKAYILYRAEHARMREEKDQRIVVEDNVPYKVLWKVFTWNVDHSCESIDKINRRIAGGNFPRLVAEAERAYHEEIKKVSAKIAGAAKDLKLVIVAGPSSSGKTTTTTKIAEQLKAKGLNFVMLNVDNYFKNLDEHPKDSYGDHDFETPEALDMELINEHILALVSGKAVKTPEYDFKTGRRRLEVFDMKLAPGEILLLDSLHGLSPQMTASVPHGRKFKFYIEALCQTKDAGGEFVRWADLRMLRRMARDSWHRAYNPEQTVGHWHYVRRSEKKYIVPYISKADYIFNGALSYELPVLKTFLYKYLKPIVNKFKSDPGKLDAYIRAKRIFDLLTEVDEFKDTDSIPKNSLIREFIGGSSYNY